jgi:hypothetical protein
MLVEDVADGADFVVSITGGSKKGRKRKEKAEALQRIRVAYT